MNRDSKILRAIGLMSGTSMDGVDVAMIETDGEGRLTFGPTSFQPYDDGDRAALRAALARAAEVKQIESDGPIARAEVLVTRRHAEAVEAFLAANALPPASVALVGFHGQTILHRPKEAITLQIGDGAALAARLGLSVAFDFRRADIEAGGEGAPIAPVFHRALVESAGLPRPIALLNVGGVANVTLVPGSGDPIACDTGPGNALLDDMMLERTGLPFDRDGTLALRGEADEAALRRLLDHPFFDLPPPKSLDRNQFSRAPVASLPVEDAAATLVAFTAETVAVTLGRFPSRPDRLVVCGGGARNQALVAELRKRLNYPTQVADELGWSADALEAQAFAYLAVRSLRGLPITFPTTTGAPRPMTGGILARPGETPPSGSPSSPTSKVLSGRASAV